MDYLTFIQPRKLITSPTVTGGWREFFEGELEIEATYAETILRGYFTGIYCSRYTDQPDDLDVCFRLTDTHYIKKEGE